MACAYLLGHGDHYTSHKFKNFYWRPFVNETRKSWKDHMENALKKENDTSTGKSTVSKNQGKFITLSIVEDYIYRPPKYEDMCLYDWIRRYKKVKRPNKKLFVFVWPRAVEN